MHDPSRYEFNKTIPTRLNEEHIPKLLKSMSWDFTEGNVLDYGCGPGGTGSHFFLPLVESTNSQMYSVDISLKMVEFASTRFPHPRIRYKLGSLPGNFPFPNIKLDKVFLIHVFHFVSDIKPMLQAILDILKPGGQLGFSTSTIKFPTYKIMVSLANSPFWGQYFKMEDYNSIAPEWTNYGTQEPKHYFKKLFLEDMGFEEISLDFIQSHILHDVPMEDFLEFALSINPRIHKFPKELLGPLKEEYRRLYTSMNAIPLDSARISLELEYLYGVLQNPLNRGLLIGRQGKRG